MHLFAGNSNLARDLYAEIVFACLESSSSALATASIRRLLHEIQVEKPEPGKWGECVWSFIIGQLN